MSKKEKVNNDEMNQVTGGAANDIGKSVEILLDEYQSGPYKCARCGKEYYLGSQQMPMSVCDECWRDGYLM